MHGLVVHLNSVFNILPVIVIVARSCWFNVHGLRLVDERRTGIRAELPAHGRKRGKRVFVEPYV